MAPAQPRLRVLSGTQSNIPSLLCLSLHIPIVLSCCYLISRLATSLFAVMKQELKRFCLVGGNAVSAFLSWRLSATNACDVTLVWKTNYQQVAQYGISFK